MWITTNWKILTEMGIPNDLTCLLRKVYAGKEVTVRTGHGTTDWFQIGKGIRQGCILSHCLFNLYAEFIYINLSLDCIYIYIHTHTHTHTHIYHIFRYVTKLSLERLQHFASLSVACKIVC